MSENTVGIWSVSPPLAAPDIPTARGSFLRLAALIGALLGTLLTLAGDGWIRPVLAAPAVAVQQEWAERPLAREWRWSPPAVNYENMFRVSR